MLCGKTTSKRELSRPGEEREHVAGASPGDISTEPLVLNLDKSSNYIVNIFVADVVVDCRLQIQIPSLTESESQMKRPFSEKITNKLHTCCLLYEHFLLNITNLCILLEKIYYYHPYCVLELNH